MDDDDHSIGSISTYSEVNHRRQLSFVISRGTDKSKKAAPVVKNNKIGNKTGGQAVAAPSFPAAEKKSIPVPSTEKINSANPPVNVTVPDDDHSIGSVSIDSVVERRKQLSEAISRGTAKGKQAAAPIVENKQVDNKKPAAAPPSVPVVQKKIIPAAAVNAPTAVKSVAHDDDLHSIGSLSADSELNHRRQLSAAITRGTEKGSSQQVEANNYNKKKNIFGTYSSKPPQQTKNKRNTFFGGLFQSKPAAPSGLIRERSISSQGDIGDPDDEEDAGTDEFAGDDDDDDDEAIGEAGSQATEEALPPPVVPGGAGINNFFTYFSPPPTVGNRPVVPVEEEHPSAAAPSAAASVDEDPTAAFALTDEEYAMTAIASNEVSRSSSKTNKTNKTNKRPTMMKSITGIFQRRSSTKAANDQGTDDEKGITAQHKEPSARELLIAERLALLSDEKGNEHPNHTARPRSQSPPLKTSRHGGDYHKQTYLGKRPVSPPQQQQPRDNRTRELPNLPPPPPAAAAVATIAAAPVVVEEKEEEEGEDEEDPAEPPVIVSPAEAAVAAEPEEADNVSMADSKASSQQSSHQSRQSQSRLPLGSGSGSGSVIINLQHVSADCLPDQQTGADEKPGADSDDEPDSDHEYEEDKDEDEDDDEAKEEEDDDELGMEEDKRFTALSRQPEMTDMFDAWDANYKNEDDYSDANTETETNTDTLAAMSRLNVSTYLKQIKAEHEEKQHLEEEYTNEKVLSHLERIRAEAVFDFCVQENDDLLMTEDQFYKALSLLGFVEKSERVRIMWLQNKKNAVDKKNFVLLLIQLREHKDDKKTADDADDNDNDAVPEDNIFTRIEEHFEALYEGTCEFDDQRDESGKKYILASELRRILTTQGQKLTDEEADELLRECTSSTHGDRIFLEQYRGLLLSSTV